MTDGHKLRPASAANSHALLLVAVLFSFCASGLARQPYPPAPAPHKFAPTATNAAAADGHWHTVPLAPRQGLPKIQTGDKVNPIWWFKNVDEPQPPRDYLPHDHNRHTKWRFRNSFHNLTFYVIGVADKKVERTGKYPKSVMNPHGGWNFAVTKYKFLRLPFVSYRHGGFEFYLGWREHGNFGTKLNIHSKKPTRTT